MDCGLATLAACFSLSGFYVDADLSYLSADIPRRTWHVYEVPHHWGVETVVHSARNDRPANPYGRLAVGYQIQFSNISLSLEGWHLSSTKDSDRGMEGVSVKARWFPFR